MGWDGDDYAVLRQLTVNLERIAKAQERIADAQERRAQSSKGDGPEAPRSAISHCSTCGAESRPIVGNLCTKCGGRFG